MKLFDTHTHLNAEQFKGIELEIIENARKQHVHYMAVVGFDEPTILKTLELSEQYDSIISAVGCHPTEAGNYTAEFEKKLEQWLELPKVKMLGEIGLDYYWDTAPKSVQEKVFRRQIAIAKEHNLPITIHNREATEDTYRILKDEGIPAAGGIMHSFGGNEEEAKKFLDLGMHISFSGVLTFKKSEEVRKAALIVPENRLLIETDAPYLAPVPYRGKRNEPGYVYYVAETLAQVRGWDMEKVAQITTQNAFDLFKWEPNNE
ncbi:TatD family hydrolase [Aerococcaceae bacterium zg-ZJ1578]|uniref:TatD family hydrolase n=1 Tax=Aerococcaceae bacterium zg-252 TaxID=2796928 RepID=UPI001A235F40|nr:TatD family hydrolase [Aerococcaceae bacterium zg-1578]